MQDQIGENMWAGSVADPGFSRQRHQSQSGDSNIFGKMKKEGKRIWTESRKRMSLASQPLDLSLRTQTQVRKDV